MSSDIIETIDNALSDWAMSDDAMRWTPEPASRQPPPVFVSHGSCGTAPEPPPSQGITRWTYSPAGSPTGYVWEVTPDGGEMFTVTTDTGRLSLNDLGRLPPGSRCKIRVRALYEANAPQPPIPPMTMVVETR